MPRRAPARLRSLLLASPGQLAFSAKTFAHRLVLEMPVRVMPLCTCAHVDARACAMHARVTLLFPAAWTCLPVPGVNPGGFTWGGGGGGLRVCASKANCKAQGKKSKASRQRQQQHNCITVIVSARSVSQASKIVQKMSCAKVPPVSSTCTPSLGA